MGIDKRLADLVGEWKGANRLHAPWLPQPLQVSDSKATVASKMNGQFLSIDYTWSFEDKPQEGMLLIGCDPKSDAVQAVWTDSWHSEDVLMLCNGRQEPGKVSVVGRYAVPDHPDWGWRTEIIYEPGAFRYVMYNLSPDGEEELAVETDFTPA